MTNQLREQFNNFLKKMAEVLDITEAQLKKAEDRYKAIGEWLGRENSKVEGFEPFIYPQGSVRLGTVIKPITDKEEYDIDLVCELKKLTKSDLTQQQLKNSVGIEIKGYNQANNMNSPPEEGRRCWKLVYADGAKFHMDILPAIPDDDLFKSQIQDSGVPEALADTAISITDDEHPKYRTIDHDWPCSNPQGYAEWFKGRMKTQLIMLAEKAKAEILDVPKYRTKTTLQQAIQLLKRHRDIMFKDDPDDKPISIIITTLAAQVYNNEPELLDALINIVNKMGDYIENRYGETWVANPVNPDENFADKWEKKQHPQREQKFWNWLKKVQNDFEYLKQDGQNLKDDNFLKSIFGDKIVNKAKQEMPKENITESGFVCKVASYLRSVFCVPHRQQPKWPIDNIGGVAVTGWVSRNGFRPHQLDNNNSPPLSKKCSLRFEARTDVSWPYKVYWQVVNTGDEAMKADGLRGGFYDGVMEKGGLVREEGTLYKGIHWIECFIVKDGICVARSGEFVVNIA